MGTAHQNFVATLSWQAHRSKEDQRLQMFRLLDAGQKGFVTAEVSVFAAEK